MNDKDRSKASKVEGKKKGRKILVDILYGPVNIFPHQ
jgi:hypothetical protein